MQQSKILNRPFLAFLFFAALFLTGSTAVAVTSGIAEKKTRFDIILKIYVNGELISSPHIRAYAHQKATILIGDENLNKDNQITLSSHSLKLELVACNVTTTDKNDGIRIDYDLQYQNGKDKIHSHPHMIVTPNQESIINVFESNHKYELRVIVKRE